jgi:hypothetical protein
MAIVGIYKTNNIQTVGGTAPQGDSVSLGGEIKTWQVVTIEDETQISALQEFDIQPVDESFVEAINGPQQEGAYNAPAYTIEGSGDKMRFENNPGQTSDGILGVEQGIELTSPDEMDSESQKNFTSEDIKPYKDAYAFIKKYDAKAVLRNNIRGNVKDIEDDIADTKVAIQMAMYYMVHEWNSRTDAEKSSNPKKDGMDKLTEKLLSDATTLRADLANGIEKINDIISTEAEINKIVTETYKYNNSRGV